MKAERLQELEEMAAKLLATARKLPPGQDRPELRLAHRGLKAKPKG